MKIQYVGKKLTKRKGCPVCGNKGRTEYRVATTNTYYLPSGNIITVRVGKEIDLPKDDAEFLLSIGGEFVVCS